MVDYITNLKWPRAGLIALLWLAFAGAAHAQVAQVELHSFETVTYDDRAFLTGRGSGETHTISGELRIPTFGRNRLPAVVLVHGVGGLSGYVSDWAREINRLGIATFTLDSFTGRGLGNIVETPGKLGRLAQIVDAYRALALLEKHPRIDPNRIAVLGFSRGGHAALYAAMTRFQRLHGADGLEFAAYLAFYPACNTHYRDDTAVSERPVRVFHGSADDFNAIGPCGAYVQRLRDAGADAELKRYADAHHVFDWPLLARPLTFKKAPVTAGCMLEEGPDSRILDAATGGPFTYASRCVRHGPTLHYDRAAHEASITDVKAVLREALKPGDAASSRSAAPRG